MKCPNCYKDIPDHSLFCGYCRASAVTPEQLFCSVCGSIKKQNSMFCSQCGASFTQIPIGTAEISGAAVPLDAVTVSKPLQNTNDQPAPGKFRKRKTRAILLLVTCLVLAAVGISAGYMIVQKDIDLQILFGGNKIDWQFANDRETAESSTQALTEPDSQKETTTESGEATITTEPDLPGITYPTTEAAEQTTLESVTDAPTNAASTETTTAAVTVAPTTAMTASSPSLYSSFALMKIYNPATGEAQFDYFDMLRGAAAVQWLVDHEGKTEAEAQAIVDEYADSEFIMKNINPQLRTIDLTDLPLKLINTRDGAVVDADIDDLNTLYRSRPDLVLDTFFYFIKVVGDEAVLVEQVYWP